jgi:hypothetical protein
MTAMATPEALDDAILNLLSKGGNR